MKRELSSLVLRWPRVDAIEEMQNRICSRWGKDVWFRGERAKRKERWKGASAIEDNDGVF